MKDLGSTVRGIRAIKTPYTEPKPRWFCDFGWNGLWLKCWTPVWHEGRGPYLSVGLGILCFGRGY